jgi:RimJ/RimL family protein N-acetyltransferase
LKSDLKLKSVTKADCPFLYDLLAKRDNHVNISHRKMPTYDEHVKFVMSKPYSKWYIIKFKNRRVGSIYLSKQNEIGIFIKNGMQGKGIGKKAMQLLMKKNPRTRYLANVNPKNIKSIDFFKKNGFRLIQYTYELIK